MKNKYTSISILQLIRDRVPLCLWKYRRIVSYRGFGKDNPLTIWYLIKYYYK